MDFRENKLEVGIGGLMVIMIVALLKLFGSFGGDKQPENQDITYEMGRPKTELVGEFGLGDREIERRSVNPFGQKDEKAAAEAKNVKSAPTVAKKSASPRNSQQPVLWVKRPGAEFSVVDKDKRGLSNEMDAAPQGAPTPNPQGAAGAKAPDDANDKKDKLSPDQWRALLAAQPTKENMNKLVEALSKGEVDEATFDVIVKGLLKSQKKDDQALALYGLNRVPTAKSFALIAGDYDTLSADIKPAAKQFLASYASPSRHGALNQALQNSNRNVALMAADVVKTGIESARNGTGTIGDPRQARGEIRSNNVSSFQSFRETFTRWAASGDAELQSRAQQILGLLGTAQA